MSTITQDSKSINAKILKALKKRALTVDEIRSRFDVSRPSWRIYDLRENGYQIVTNRRVIKGGPKRGQVVTEYELV